MKAISENERKFLSILFQEYEWNYFADAILDGNMGDAYADDEKSPNIAVLDIPKLPLCIIGGNATHKSARKYLNDLTAPKMMIFASEGWEELLQELYRGRLAKMNRYAFTSENLDMAHLSNLKSKLPDGYRLTKLTIELAEELANEKSDFSSDHMMNFNSPQDFIERGFGYCVCDDDKIASVATTFAICDKGIEIQISTRKNYQGRGLGTAVAAQLLIYCLDNNLDPNWDAANKKSVGLAKNLGYTPQGNYSIHILARSRFRAVLGKLFLRIQERM